MLDKANARIITVGLVAIVVIAIVGAIVLSMAERAIPSEVTDAGKVGLGGILALATVRKSTPEPPAPTVAAPSAGPVPPAEGDPSRADT